MTDNQGSIELIISTYNNPNALDLCLTAVSLQNVEDFMTCIADDGSGKETEQLARQWAARFPKNRLRHVWHEDNGFQKNKILNRAIATSSAEYLIFIDGDCIPSANFIERHIKKRKPNAFLTGGVIRLDSIISKLASKEVITSGEIFKSQWLSKNRDEKRLGRFLKSSSLPMVISHFLELVTPVKRTWNGGNSSTWRENLILVNGFEEDLKYGAEDIELGYRLNNAGIKGISIRYTAPLLHLHHTRSYADPAIAKENKIYATNSRLNKNIRATQGISQQNITVNQALQPLHQAT